MAQAAVSCRGYGAPKDKAECLMRNIVQSQQVDHAQDVQSQIRGLLSKGFRASGDVTSALVNGTCQQTNRCDLNYLVSADFFRGSEVKSVTAIISGSNNLVEPKIIRIVTITEE